MVLSWAWMTSWPYVASALCAAAGLTFVYLIRVNSLLKRVPPEVQQFAGPPWTKAQLQKTYDELEKHPLDYTSKLPPKQDRRYIVTGGNGLVGGYVVLQLLARNTDPKNIRIIDIRKPERNDMSTGPATEIEFIPTDIRSKEAVIAAFHKPWHPSVARLPLTVFHTAAVILASDRSEYLYDLPREVNVEGTQHLLAAAKAAGADVFSSTSSASICIRFTDAWVPFWYSQVRNFWQILDTQDFDYPLRRPAEFFGNYPRSKATAERMVCEANSEDFRTGCIRPANGVYGNPTDNTVGGPLSSTIFPTWVPHIVQSFVHGANVAIAHLQHEAVLLSQPRMKDIPQAGRPFVVTDPNPPISYADLYKAISVLSVHYFCPLVLPPVLILLLAYLSEFYILLPYRIPWLKKILPPISGDARSLQPGLFSICTHLIASDSEARKPLSQGGLGYEGVITTLQGMTLELLDWNREHEQHDSLPKAGQGSRTPNKKRYTTSITYADQLRQAKYMKSRR